jgi:hypothetical protein
LLGAVVAGGIGVAVAQSSSSETFYACVSTSGVLRSHTIRVDVPAASCPRASDTVRSWNQNGEVGPQGPEGPQGLEGPQGEPAVVRGALRPFAIEGDQADASFNWNLPPVDTSDCASIAFYVEGLAQPVSGQFATYTAQDAAQPVGHHEALFEYASAYARAFVHDSVDQLFRNPVPWSPGPWTGIEFGIGGSIPRVITSAYIYCVPRG